MPYVQLGAVRTWYETHGEEGPPVVLLHPGHADTRAWESTIPALADRYRVFVPDRRGHGRTPDVPGPITQDAMAEDTAAFLDTVVGEPAHVIGCSDGTTVALLTALKRPDRVLRLVACCGVFHHEGWIPGAIDLPPDVRQWFEDVYAEVSPDGRAHFAVVKEKLDRMHREEPTLGPADLARIACPTLVMGGDRDEVTLAHLIATYRGIPTAELAILPGTGHGVPGIRPDPCNALITTFLAGAD